MKAKEYTLSRIAAVPKGSGFERKSITSSIHAADFARQFYYEDMSIFESVFIILLNRANQTIGWAKISQGGIDSSVMDIRIIAKYALDTMATGVILVHNHPSGNAVPSMADRKHTERVKDALGLLEVQLLDHIILTEDKHYSFCDEGIL